MNWRSLILIITCIGALLCQGCSPTYFERVRYMTETDYKAMHIINKLQKKDVKVFLYENKNYKDKDALGTIKIIINDQDIFNKDSANFNDNALRIFDQIISLLNLYEEEDVKVQGGINSQLAKDIKYKNVLALAKAHKVAQYLWSQDINATFLYSVNADLPKDSVAIVFQKFRKY